jgi:hypothetical protein
MKERIGRIIQTYDTQGIHRTGTEVDHRSASWLAGEAEHLGATVELDTFAFERVEIHVGRLDVGELQIEGIPLFDCRYTDVDGIRGTIGEVGSAADIGIAMIPPAARGDLYDKIIAARESDGHKAIVLVTAEHMPGDGVATINAEAFASPFGPPVLQVSNDHWGEIRRRIREGADGRVVAHCEHVAATATNVQATVTGTDESLAPIVVMTPRSGWWWCASERGGGIAAWLEILRAVVKGRPARTVIFTANTGHELGHTGLDHYLETHEGLIRNAHLWVHLGANFAAGVGDGIRLQFSSEQLRIQLLRFAESADVNPASETPVEMRPFGEARNIFDGGGNYISILGSNGLFHHPADRYPDAVNLDMTTRWTTVFVEMVLSTCNQS